MKLRLILVAILTVFAALLFGCEMEKKRHLEKQKPSSSTMTYQEKWNALRAKRLKFIASAIKAEKIQKHRRIIKSWKSKVKSRSMLDSLLLLERKKQIKRRFVVSMGITTKSPRRIHGFSSLVSSNTLQEVPKNFLHIYKIWKNADKQIKNCKVIAREKNGVRAIVRCGRVFNGLSVHGDFIQLNVRKSGKKSWKIQAADAKWHLTANPPKHKLVESTLLLVLRKSNSSLDFVYKDKKVTSKWKKLAKLRNRRFTLKPIKVLFFDKTKQALSPAWIGVVKKKGARSNDYKSMKRFLYLESSGRLTFAPVVRRYSSRLYVETWSPNGVAGKRTREAKTLFCRADGNHIEENYFAGPCAGQSNMVALSDKLGHFTFPMNNCGEVNFEPKAVAGVIPGAFAPAVLDIQQHKETVGKIMNASGGGGNPLSMFLWNIYQSNWLPNLCDPLQPGFDPNWSCICDLTNSICSTPAVSYFAHYHLMMLARTFQNLGVPGLIEFEVDPNMGTLCGEQVTFPLGFHLVRISSNPACLLNDDDHPFRVNYHEGTHAITALMGYAGPGNQDLPNDTEFAAFEEGRAEYIASSASKFTAGKIIVQGIDNTASPFFRKYPDDFNNCAKCPAQTSSPGCPCTTPGGGCSRPCTSHYNGDIWGNTLLNLEKMIGKNPTWYNLLWSGPSIAGGSSFIDQDDMIAPDCMPGINPKVDVSYLSAMLQTNETRQGSHYTVEIWRAFNSMLSNNTCVAPKDDFSNYIAAASFINFASGPIQVANKPFDGFTNLTVQLDYPGDIDYFSFFTEPERKYKITNPNSSGAIKVRILSETNQALSFENQNGASVNEQVLNSGEFLHYSHQSSTDWVFIEVQGADDGQTGTYSLELLKLDRFQETQKDDHSDQRTLVARPVANNNVAYSGTINPSQDKDVFRFYASEQKYQITVTPTNQNVDVKIELHRQSPSNASQTLFNPNSNCTIIQPCTVYNEGGAGVAEQAETTQTLQAGQWYYVTVTGVGGTTGAYTIKVKAINSIEYEHPPGNGMPLVNIKNFDQAFPMEHNALGYQFAAHFESGLLSSSKLETFFSVELKERERLTVDVIDPRGTSIIKTKIQIFGSVLDASGTINPLELRGLRSVENIQGSNFIQFATPQQIPFLTSSDGGIEPMTPRLTFTSPRQGRYVIRVSALNENREPPANFAFTVQIRKDDKPTSRQQGSSMTSDLSLREHICSQTAP